MVPARRGSDPPPTDRLVTYSIDRDETAVEAVTAAFDALETDVRERETTLYDHVATDAMDELFAAEMPVRLELSIWHHPVVLTPETVRVYEVPDE
ncbi:hypothetical protein [Halolamina rubra]|uniref:hypothetical protein n=1 Tax=Halolamina rubra TaxID=1380430 RepID=UPI000679A0F1|nr:hypothetical protein [Halolamina rubra]